MSAQTDAIEMATNESIAAENYKRLYLDALTRIRVLERRNGDDRIAALERQVQALTAGQQCSRDGCGGTMKYAGNNWSKCDACGFDWRPE